MTIFCSNCGFDDFISKSGIFFCTRCQQESAEHGHETAIDEDFFGAFGSSASTLQRQSLRKKRINKKRQKWESSVTFTRSDVFSYILKAWVDELIELGSEPRLKDVVLAIWCRYLQYQKLAFVEKGESTGLGITPNFRDIQVKAFGRKTILDAKEAKGLVNRQTSKQVSSSSSDEHEGDPERERKRRRRRRKARRNIHKKMAGEFDVLSEHMETSDSYASFSSTATFASDCSLSDLESSHQSSQLSDSSYSSDMEVMELLEERRNKEKDVRDALILSRFSVNHPTGIRDQKLEQKFNYNLRTVFACLALGVILNRGNKFTLADLLYWAETNAFSVRNPLDNVPPILKMRNASDKQSFKMETSIRHLTMRLILADLACKLRLKHIDFNLNNQPLRHVMKKYLEEFALPNRLRKIVLESLEFTTLMDLTQTFPEGNVAFETRRKMRIHTVEVRCLALILFVLKYIFVLDDVTELKISRWAQEFNSRRDPHSDLKKKFDFMKWLELSRLRIFLALRHSHILHRKFKSLMPNVNMTNRAELESEFKSSEHKVKCPIGTKLLEELERIENESKEPIRHSNLDLRKSVTPLEDFAKFVLSDANDLDIDAKHIENLRGLMEMKELSLRYLDEENQEDFTLSHRTFGRLPGESTYNMIHYTNTFHELSDEFNDSSTQKSFPARKYWRLNFRTRLEPTCAAASFVKNKDYACAMESMLPENFFWLLNYFSIHCDISVNELFGELILVEDLIDRQDLSFFSEEVEGDKKKKERNRASKMSADV